MLLILRENENEERFNIRSFNEDIRISVTDNDEEEDVLFRLSVVTTSHYDEDEIDRYLPYLQNKPYLILEIQDDNGISLLRTSKYHRIETIGMSGSDNPEFNGESYPSVVFANRIGD